MVMAGGELRYENQHTEKILCDPDLLKKKVGLSIARAIKKRFGEIIAANNFSIYLATGLGKPHSLSEDLKGCYGVRITSNVRLIIRPDVKCCKPETFKECEVVIIKGVKDYHGRKKRWLIP